MSRAKRSEIMVPKKIVRQLIMLHSAAILTFSAQAALASNVGVDLNIRLGAPRQVVVPEPVYVAPPAPVYYAPPAPAMAVEEDVQFVYPEGLGFYVAVGVPYDLFYLNNSYFIVRDGRWLRSSSSRGPWVVQRSRDLPPTLRRNRLERIREYRNREYVVYNRDREHYRGRRLHSDKGYWKEQRKDDKEQRKDEKRFEKGERKDQKRFEKEQRRDDKEQRKDDKRAEKEERREQRGGRD
jgi:hypothetical protein